MKILLIVHPDLVPPEDINESEIDWAEVPWMTEYDVLKTLRASGHEVHVVGVYDSLKQIRKEVDEFKPSVIFNLLEEFRGEAIFDQNVVSYLELIGAAYSGCNPKGLILARDKALSKKILTYHRLKTPKFQIFPRNQAHRKPRIKKYPVIVKCLNEEASMGISQASVVHNQEALVERAHFIHRSFGVDAIAEEFIEGREYFVGVLGNYRLKTFTPWELRFKDSDNPEKELYSANAKHSFHYRQRKGIETGHAKIDDDLKKKLQVTAKKVYRALGLNGYARIDFRVNDSQECYVLEANPNPDISEFDDFAASALHDGIKYSELLEKIISLGRQWSPEKGPAPALRSD